MRAKTADGWEAEVQQLQETNASGKDAKKKALKQTLKNIICFVDAG